jgi:hypothetical protein
MRFTAAQKQQQRVAADKLQNDIATALRRGEKQFRVTRGDYRFIKPWPGTTTATFRFGNVRDFTLDGQGARFFFESPEGGRIIGGFWLGGCKNVAIKNLTLDWDPVPFTQGTIVSANPDTRELVFKPDAGYEHIYPAMRKDEGRDLRIFVFDKATRRLTPFQVRMGVMALEKGRGAFEKPEADDSYRLLLSLGPNNAQHVYTPAAQGIVPGASVAIVHRSGPWAVPGLARRRDSRCCTPLSTQRPPGRFLRGTDKGTHLFIASLLHSLLPRSSTRAKCPLQTETHGRVLLPSFAAEGASPTDRIPLPSADESRGRASSAAWVAANPRASLYRPESASGVSPALPLTRVRKPRSHPPSQTTADVPQRGSTRGRRIHPEPVERYEASAHCTASRTACQKKRCVPFPHRAGSSSPISSFWIWEADLNQSRTDCSVSADTAALQAQTS